MSKRNKKRNKSHRTVCVKALEVNPLVPTLVDKSQSIKILQGLYVVGNFAKKFKYIAAVFLVITLVGAGVWHKHQQIAIDRDELEALRKKEGVQLQKIEELARITGQLQADMDRLNRLDAEIRMIVNNEEQTSTSRAGLTRLTSVYDSKSYHAYTALDEVSSTIHALKTEIPVREQSLEGLKQELLEKKAKTLARPSIWPVRGDVTSRFGWRSLYGNGKSDFHPGLDIANMEGTPIIATADGIVVHSGWDDGGYGQMVEIDHGNGIVTIYAHNSEVAVYNGQKVKRGEVISYIGNTGYSTGPHLHYEVRVNGTAVDPTQFLS